MFLGQHLKEIILAVLLSEKEPARFWIGPMASEKSGNGAIAVGEMEPGRFVIFVDSPPVLTQGHETQGSAANRSHVVSPDGVKFVELIVQRVPAVFGREQGRVISKAQVIEARVIRVSQDDETDPAGLAIWGRDRRGRCRPRRHGRPARDRSRPLRRCRL